MNKHMHSQNHSLEESIDALNDNEQNHFLRIMHFVRYEWATERITTALNINQNTKFNNIDGDRKDKLIIDAACGRGYGSKILSSAGNVLGLDICQEAIDYANNKYSSSGIEFKLCNLETESILEKTEGKLASAVVSFETLEHCANPEKVLKNFYNTLIHNGILIISVPNGINERKNKQGKPYYSYHVNSYTPEQIYSIIEKANFSNIKMYSQLPIYGLLMKYIRKGVNFVESLKQSKNNLAEKNESEWNDFIPKKGLVKKLVGIRDLLIPQSIARFIAKPIPYFINTSDEIIIEAKK